jgi:O-antigen ligase
MIYSGQIIPDLPKDVLKNPEFLRRIARDRIFSTFWNANALAGAMLLLLPLSLTFLWRLTPKVRFSIRLGFVLILGGCGLATLYWTGSKAGWLIALAVGLIALGHSRLQLKWRCWLIGGILMLGILGFVFKYASFFHQERNSVGARFGYWRAAEIIIRTHPLFGTGPGTFQIPFERIRRPTDEPAKLVHNDYLEQGCDSGILGMICYIWMTVWFMYFLYRYRVKRGPLRWLNFAVLLGVFGVCLQSAVDCHLYVPALAWPMFFMFGWLMGL